MFHNLPKQKQTKNRERERDTLTKAAYFSDLYYHVKFHNCPLSGVSVTLSSEVCTDIKLVLLMVEN